MKNTHCEDHDLLIRIDERLLKLCNTLEEHVNRTNKQFEELNKRVKKVEEWKTYASGAIAIIGIIFTSFQARIMRWI
jgi:hypothetical protein